MADDEDEEIISIPQSLNNWEQIHPSSSSSSLPPLLFKSSSTNSSAAQTHDQAQVHLRGWEMVVSRNIDRDRDRDREKNNLYDDDDCFIFPPSNHEGLHIPSQQHQSDEVHHHHEDEEEEEGEPLSSVSASDPLESSQSLDSRLRVAGETLKKRLDFGFEVLWSNLIQIGSWVRSHISARRNVGSFNSPATGVGAVFLVSLLYLRWQQQRRRRRRRSQQEMKDRLMFLIERTDEKLSQILDQITQMNEVLSARRRVPI